MIPASLRLVFWETTKACNLTCRHCRAVPQRKISPMELTTNGAFDLIDAIAQVARPVFVLSGGEPLFRPDLFDIGEYGVQTGFRMALATNGTLVTDRIAARIADTGFSRVAISIDGGARRAHGSAGSCSTGWPAGIRNLRSKASRCRSIRRSRSNVAKSRHAGSGGRSAPTAHFHLVPSGAVYSLRTDMLPAAKRARAALVRQASRRAARSISSDLRAALLPAAERSASNRAQRGDITTTSRAAHEGQAAPSYGAAGTRPSYVAIRAALAGRAYAYLDEDALPLRLSAGQRRDTRVQRFWRHWNG